MQKFGRGVVKLRVPILIVSVLLLIPSIFGFLSTRINYDILSYLPSDIETMKGQDIICLLYTSTSPRDRQKSRMPSSA